MKFLLGFIAGIWVYNLFELIRGEVITYNELKKEAEQAKKEYYGCIEEVPK